MTAVLGQTTNPKELIPGEPELIGADLRELLNTVKGIDGIGEDLSRVDPIHWAGDASTAFRTAFGAQLPRWAGAVEALGGGAQALADYGDVLAWAQREAQRAIEAYTEALAASRTAAAEYNARAQTSSIPLPPFDDPAQGAAHAAQAILDDARAQLAIVGDKVAHAFGFEPNGEGGYQKDLGGRDYGAEGRTRKWDPEKGAWVEEDGDAKGWRGKSEREWGSQSDGLLTDLIGDTLGQLGIDIPEKTWSAEADVALFDGGLSGEFESGVFSGSGTLEGSVLGAGAEAHAGVSALGLTAGASAEAYLAKGSMEGAVKIGDHVGVSGNAEAMVGAAASAQGTVGWLGAQGNAEAFVGARASGDVSAEVAGVSAGAHGEAWAGLGAEASGQFGMGDDGKFHIGGSVGLAVGVGGKVGFDIAVDPSEVVDTVTDVATDVADVATDVGRGAANAAGDVADFLGF